MPIYDGSLADHYHRQDRIQVTRRLRSELAVNNPAELPNWFQAPKVYLHMHRRAYELCNVPIGRAIRLKAELNLNASHNVLLVGAAFGWEAEALKGLGIAAVCMDSGAWIHAAKDQDEAGEIEVALDLAGVTSGHAMRAQFFNKLIAGPRATEIILEEDALTKGSRQRIRNKGAFSHIVTASVLPWLHDDEVVNLSDALRQINVAAQIAHYVQFYKDDAAAKPEPAPFLNWKRVVGGAPVVQRLSDQAWYTTNSWPALLPNDTFIGV